MNGRQISTMAPSHNFIPSYVHIFLFDMDGVITSEACYWDAARLTVLEVLGHPHYASWKATGFDPTAPLETLLARSQSLLSDGTIAQIKARAINTNWDVAYLMASLYLVHLCSQLAPADRKQMEGPLAASGWNASTLQLLGSLLPLPRGGGEGLADMPRGSALWSDFAAFLGERKGFAALEALNAYWQARTGQPSAPFQRGEGFWRFCQELFQAWYLGRGLIHRERPLLPAERVRETLTCLQEAGCTLGVATGRPYPEIVPPLEAMGLLSLFDPNHFATHREVEAAEAELRREGLEAALSKPHPFLFLRALYPRLSAQEIWQGRYSPATHREVAVVGDAVSDVVAAKAIGCYSISVLTGGGTADALREAGTDCILPDMTDLPSHWKGPAR